MAELTGAWAAVAAKRDKPRNPSQDEAWQQPRGDGWENVIRDRQSSKLISQTEIDEPDLREFLRLQKVSKLEFDKLYSWERIEVLRQCREWLDEQNAKNEEEA